MGRGTIQCCGELNGDSPLLKASQSLQWQDDMAEHTMHSPVWISYRPGFDWVDGDTDIDQ